MNAKAFVCLEILPSSLSPYSPFPFPLCVLLSLLLFFTQFLMQLIRPINLIMFSILNSGDYALSDMNPVLY